MKYVNFKHNLWIGSFNISVHDDVIKWRHFPRHWPFVRRIHRSPVNSPHKGQWRGALMFTLICARIKGWVNNCEAGDLRRNRAHYDVIVMRHCTLEWMPEDLADGKLSLVHVMTWCRQATSYYLNQNWPRSPTPRSVTVNEAQCHSNFNHAISYVCLRINYRKVSNIRRTLVWNKIIDHSDVVGASPVGAAPTTSSFST